MKCIEVEFRREQLLHRAFEGLTKGLQKPLINLS